MKKFILCASAIGLAIGITTYIFNKKSKSDVSENQSVENEFDRSESNTSDQKFVDVTNVVEDVTNAKRASAYSIHARHTEAANIMHNAFENIYKDIKTDKDIETEEYDEKTTDSIIVECDAINSEMDSLSDELDNLLG